MGLAESWSDETRDNAAVPFLRAYHDFTFATFQAHLEDLGNLSCAGGVSFHIRDVA